MRITTILLAMIAALALLLAACGGGGDDLGDSGESTPTEAADTGGAATPTDDAGGDDTGDDDDGGSGAESVEVNEEFYHAGWHVTLGTASVESDSFLGSIDASIEATFENLGSNVAVFDSTLLLTSGGNDYPDEAFTGHDLPQVQGKRSADGSFNFTVDEEFTFDDATLIIGHPNNNQAIVPLGPGGEDLVTLAPVEIAVTGDAIAGSVTASVERVELRADLPEDHGIADKDHLYLTVYFSVTPQAGIPVGSGLIEPENFLIEEPDGSRVAATDASLELLQGKEGTTIDDLFALFEVDNPAEGEFKFIVFGNYSAAGEVEGELAFTIE